MPVDILITDLRVPQIGGLELLKRVRTSYPQTAVLVLTQYGTLESAVEATRLGAADYITKPFHIPELRSTLDRMIRLLDVDQENRRLRETLRTRPGFADLIGVSVKMQRVYRWIERVSQHAYPVLILGESRTGKERVARSVHSSGVQRNKPFIPVDGSSLVPTLIEAELFGYVKGAFTGALHAKQGLLETADGGTLFLDEIGDLPFDMQAKLLRALQKKEVRPVGSTDRIPLSARIIAATNRDLENAIERAIALGSGPILQVGDLPTNLQYGTGDRLPQNDEPLPLDEVERRAILRALREAGGDKLAAARMLGIGKTTLYRKLKQYDAQTQAEAALNLGG
jgi:DNA-binding NtrC family response regulator